MWLFLEGDGAIAAVEDNSRHWTPGMSSSWLDRDTSEKKNRGEENNEWKLEQCHSPLYNGIFLIQNDVLLTTLAWNSTI